MKRNLPRSTKNIKELSGCWIFKEGEYFFADLRITGYTLPSVKREYEFILKEMGIPYRIINKKGIELCEYWSLKLYNAKKYKALLYVYQEGEYKFKGTKYEGTIVSINTVEEARKVQKQVQLRQKEYDREKLAKGI